MRDPGSQPDRTPLVQIGPLPQVVPSRVCLSCDVCCRFPEEDSFLRPYFTAEEIRRAVAAGLDPARFPDPAGSQVRLVPNPAGEGYCCPAFDPATSHCRIYEGRPLDCQIYPLALMWRAAGREIVLGWDSKCPFLAEGEGPGARGNGEAVRGYAERIVGLIESDRTLDLLAGNPGLIGRFQDDVVVLRPLPRLTARLRPVASRPSLIAPRPLTWADRPLVEQACATVESPLAAFAFAPHLIWRSLFAYSWAEVAGHFCLFAEYGDGLFMPLPPLPLRPAPAGEEDQAARFAEAMARAFEFMRLRNGGRAVTRVENVPQEWTERCEALGYRVRPKDPDYLYLAHELAGLKGDRYKSQRAACNRFIRTHRSEIQAYRDEHRDECLALFARWAAQKQAAGADEVAGHLLRDSAAAHREALVHHRELGLVGSVVRVDDAVGAYTLGFGRSPAVFCVLLEVADRAVPGLAAFLFRETCRAALERGSRWINSMDDSGLQGLARSKRAYRPVRLVESYVVTEA